MNLLPLPLEHQDHGLPCAITLGMFGCVCMRSSLAPKAQAGQELIFLLLQSPECQGLQACAIMLGFCPLGQRLSAAPSFTWHGSSFLCFLELF